MTVLDWIWIAFIFTTGCCVGSFLNVVIYRLPRDKSLIRPASACPACGRPIRFYDNIPLVSWLALRAKCRYCKAAISPRYFIIELLTGLVFVGVFLLYFYTEIRVGVRPFWEGGWFVYVIHIILLAAFIAASAIDLELWVIPLNICWFVTAVGMTGSAMAVFIIDPGKIRGHLLLPSAPASTASLALGGAVGLGLSLLLLKMGVIKTSYETEKTESSDGEAEESEFKHRLEVCKEVWFLLPIFVFAIGSYWVFKTQMPVRQWWIDFSQIPAVAGFLGSLWGYFVGCGVVWATRILGTLAFGKEAMGLGDVHLMGAAGAIVGPVFVVVAFFIAPFFGLAWAGIQMFFKKIQQIPYGPFLSLGVLAVMILHDRIWDYLIILFYR